MNNRLSTSFYQNATIENFRPRALDTSCCIFKIPEFLTRNKQNSDGYQPTTVSIGPYHKGKQQLQSIQEHKQRFQEFFLSEAEKYDVSEGNLRHVLAGREREIRNSYSETLVGFPSDALIETIFLDGCFLLTLFLVVAEKLSYQDPVFCLPWVLPSIRRDLLLLENQIPLFILHILLETVNFPCTRGRDIHNFLNSIVFEFFSYSFDKLWRRRALHHNVQNRGEKHLLDLIRHTFFPILTSGTDAIPEPSGYLKLILSAKNLRSSGIRFKSKSSTMANTFLDITLTNGKLHIPEIALDNFSSLVLLNCIAFEQFCGNSTNHITSYAMFMGSLINNERDAAFLEEEGIIQKYLGTDDEVSRFFKSITKDCAFDINRSYLKNVLVGVNRYTDNCFNVKFAGFKQTYFGSLWIIVSSFAALVLLVLTLFQVFYAAGVITPRSQGKENGKQG